MGDPKRIRRKYEKTKMMWNKQRIDEEHGMCDKFGLANLRELWKATTEVATIRKNVREVLSGRAEDKVGKDIIGRLARYGIVRSTATLDDLLSVSPEAILERRLQSVVYKKGMAKTIKQSRQLIAHGFIAINGRRVNAPGYLVPRSEDEMISYYKPININHSDAKTGAAATATVAAPAAPESAAQEKAAPNEAQSKGE